MKFVSDILAKAGLVVDGVVTFNNTATGQTPAANDNSTKLATTAWVQNYVVPYSLPTASDTILGGVKVGTGLAIDGSGVLSVTSTGSSTSFFKAEQTFTATAGQTTFTFVDGYAPGYVDVFLNGVYLSKTEYVATDGTTIVLNDACLVSDIVTVLSYSTYIIGETPSARTTCRITATAGQTSFPCTYAVGQIDVFYNGSKLDTSEYTATDGANVILGTPALVDDKIEIVTWLVGGGIASSRTITINGVTYDLSTNRTWTTLPSNGTTGQILAKASNTSYDTTWIDNYTSEVKHIVKAGIAVTKGQAVYVSSADGTNMIVSKASNSAESTSSKTLGLVAQDLALNGQGYVVTEGLLAGLDTTGANAAGDPVWLGTDGNLVYGLVNKPVAPAHLVFIGVVTRINANNGEIFVKVQNGYELNEIHDALITSPSTGDGLFYETSAGVGLWKNKTIASVLGYTPANEANVLALSGGTLTGSLIGTSATFTNYVSVGGGSEGLRLGNVGDNSAYDNVKFWYTGYNSGSPRVYLTPRQTPGSGIVNTFFYLQNSNGTSTSANNTMGLIVDGAIGIGTTPSYLLDIYAATPGATSNILRLKNGSNDVSTGLRIKWDFASLAGAYLDVTTDSGGSKSMILYLSSANAIPSQVFQIVGSTGAATFSSSVTVNGIFNFPNGSISATGELVFNASAYNIYTYGRIGLPNAGRIILNNGTGANLFFGELASNIYGFTPSAYNSTPNLTMDLANNRVGIGTTSPAGKFEIKSAAQNYTTAPAITFTDNTGISDSRWILGNIATTYGAFNLAEAASASSTTYTPRITILPGGNLGIGTTSPNTKLEVYAGDPTGTRTNPLDVLTIAADNSNNPYSGFGGAIVYRNRAYTGSMVNSARIRSRISDDSTQNYGGAISFDVTATVGSGYTTAMTINYNSFVGIGTTNPGYKLDVSGAGRFTSDLYGSGDIYTANALRFNGSGLNASDKKLYSPADGELQWMTHTSAGYHAFSISHQGTRIVNLDINGNSYFNGGNTGFGLTNPSHRVHVSGNIYSTDTVYARNLKPEGWASVSAGSPTSATIPYGYSMISISSPCDNNWRSILTNINDTKAYFWVALGDAASKDTANYFMSMTSPAYGVSNFGNVSYQDNGWNTGGFEFTYDNLGNGTHRLLVRCTSYYGSGNTAYGNIYFLRIE